MEHENFCRKYYLSSVYVLGKAHKYGAKMYKLCTVEEYTWNLKVYCGKMPETVQKKLYSKNVVMTLMKNLFITGRELYAGLRSWSRELEKILGCGAGDGASNFKNVGAELELLLILPAPQSSFTLTNKYSHRIKILFHEKRTFY